MGETEKIQEAFVKLGQLDFQVGRLVSDIQSEKGTLTREATRLREEIAIVERTFREIIYDSEKGLLIKLDRLVQESESRKKTRQNIIGLWLAVLIIFIKEAIDLLKNK